MRLSLTEVPRLTLLPRLAAMPRGGWQPATSRLPRATRLTWLARRAQPARAASERRGARRLLPLAGRHGAVADRPANGQRAAVATLEQRNRSAGGPQDRALYACSCGTLFTADVSATVTCPHCGLPQAW